MEQFEPEAPFGTASPEEMADYLCDMIEQMACIARNADHAWIAMHLEAIIIAQRAISRDRPER